MKMKIKKDSRNTQRFSARQQFPPKKKFCYFCKEKIDEVDYQSTELLKKYLDYYNRIQPASRTGNCTKHQRQLGRAIKRARSMALLPYV